jgi:hypothetical protein
MRVALLTFIVAIPASTTIPFVAIIAGPSVRPAVHIASTTITFTVATTQDIGVSAILTHGNTAVATYDIDAFYASANFAVPTSTSARPAVKGCFFSSFGSFFVTFIILFPPITPSAMNRRFHCTARYFNDCNLYFTSLAIAKVLFNHCFFFRCTRFNRFCGIHFYELIINIFLY